VSKSKKGSLRILHVIGSLGCGGAQVVLRHLVESMDKELFEQWVYVLRCQGVQMPVKGRVITKSYRNYDPRKFFTILRLCKKLDVDIVSAHLTKPIIGCLLATFFRRFKLVVHEHGPVLGTGLEPFLYRMALRLLWRRATVFVAVSQETADFLTRKIKIPVDRVKVVNNAVDLDIFDPQLISKNQAREKLGISLDDFVLGFVGRLCNQKGVDLLIEAAALLMQRSRRYLLLLAGDGQCRTSLEQQARELGFADRVRFLGFCSNISEVMATFDVGIVPSRWEPFGIVCLEMMRMKVPVVSSGVQGLAEIIKDQKTGLVTTDNTPTEIARCVQRLYKDELLRNELVKTAYQFCDRFSTVEYAKTMSRLYEQILYRKD